MKLQLTHAQSGTCKGTCQRPEQREDAQQLCLGLSSLRQGLNKIMWLCRVRDMLLDPGLKAVSPEDLQVWITHGVMHNWSLLHE